MSSPVSGFQTLMALAAPAPTRYLPSALQATPVKRYFSLVTSRRNFSLVTSQNLTVPSWLPLARRRPSGAKATLQTKWVCPRSVSGVSVARRGLVGRRLFDLFGWRRYQLTRLFQANGQRMLVRQFHDDILTVDGDAFMANFQFAFAGQCGTSTVSG